MKKPRSHIRTRTLSQDISTPISRTWEWASGRRRATPTELQQRYDRAKRLASRRLKDLNPQERFARLEPCHLAEIKMLLDAHNAAIRAGLGRRYGVSVGDVKPMLDPDREDHPHDYINGYEGSFDEDAFHG